MRTAAWEEEEPVRAEGVSADDLDAHRHVLEMARTIEVLRRDYELMQSELSAAYAQLRECSAASTTGRDSNVSSRERSALGLRGDEVDCCSHQREVDELRKLVEVKDVALTEALEQRNQHRVEVEKAEALVRELRALHLEAVGGRSNSSATRSPSGGWYSTCIADSSSAVRPPSSHSASALLGAPSTAKVPHMERFDQESAYHRRENDALFWRKQYRDAVRMRKKPSLVNMTQPPGSTRSGSATATAAGGGRSEGKPSLKIFSAPNSQRQRVITDENIPFSRYIGISARQHEIIKEQHRILS